MTPRPFAETHLDALALAVDFTRADLAANQNGHLSPRQINQLQADQRRQFWPTYAAWITLGLVIGALALLHLALAREWLIVLAGMTVLGGMSVYELRMSLHDIEAEQEHAAPMELSITAEWQPRRRWQTIEFTLNECTFRAPRALANVLREGLSYRIYHAPDVCAKAPCRILSIEPILPDQPVPQGISRAA